MENPYRLCYSSSSPRNRAAADRVRRRAAAFLQTEAAGRAAGVAAANARWEGEGAEEDAGGAGGGEREGGGSAARARVSFSAEIYSLLGAAADIESPPPPAAGELPGAVPAALPRAAARTTSQLVGDQSVFNVD